ncbi:MAG: hypothetical protein L6R35_001091 [Caloplaca aegaea]|nr:MAG: hypothetical protein L6R35_001091 [Caloplaca aegaea]
MAVSKVRFVDLPLETQKHVFSYLGHKDLLPSLTVSRHFFTLACAQVYRVLDFKLTNSDTVDEGGWSMRTAEALQTVVASDYNYGQHIKSFRINMVDDNTQSSLVMSRFLWDRAGFASKTLNTSLLLLLKKATALESFLWDVPIELSGAVYQALHKIQGLRQLRLRLDVSLFSNLKLILHAGPLPGSSGISNHPPSTNLSSSFPSLPPLNTSNPLGTLPGPKGRTIKKKKNGARSFWAGNRELSGFKQLHSLSLLGISSLDYLDEISGCLKSSTTTLKSLSLSLSHETAQKARKASASPPPADDVTSEDEEDDELVDHPPPPPPVANSIPTLPTRTEADVRKEKQAQEAILARIFDMEQHNNESKKLERSLVLSPAKLDYEPGFKNVMRDIKAMAQKLSELKKGESIDPSDAREAIEMVHKATAQFLSKDSSLSKKIALEKGTASGTSDVDVTEKSLPSFGSAADSLGLFNIPNESSSSAALTQTSAPNLANLNAHKAVLDFAKNKGLNINSLLPLEDQLSADASKSYLSCPPPGAAKSSAPFQPPTALYSPPSQPHSGSSSAGTNTPVGELDPSLLNSSKAKSSVTGDGPSWGNMADPASSSKLGQGSISLKQSNGSKDPLVSALAVASDFVPPTSKAVDESGDIDMIHPDEDPTEIIADQEMISDDEDSKNATSEEAGSLSPRKRVRFDASQEAEAVDGAKSTASQVNGGADIGDTIVEQEQSPEEIMQAWIREAHGYQLEEVRLHWIPMRAGILSRALDLAVLRRLTLLNCGTQDGFWMILAGFQARQGTIALTSIHTDNVSKSFLKFLKSFEGMTELFMHERSKKHQVEAVSAQNKTSITDIRRQALRKHLRTLKRLMIKNEYDSSWDLDAITITLLSSKGAKLVELAVSLGALPFHQLMQNFPSLKSLQALHLLTIRGAPDVTLSHLEYLNSIVDVVSHNPGMRLKYVAIDNIISTILRRTATTIRKIRQPQIKRQQMRLEREKGKGKEKEGEKGFASDASSETDYPDDKDLHDMYAMKMKASMIIDVKEVEQQAKIFQNEFRAGAF